MPTETAKPKTKEKEEFVPFIVRNFGPAKTEEKKPEDEKKDDKNGDDKKPDAKKEEKKDEPKKATAKPKPVAPAPVTTAPDYEKITEAVVKGVTTATAAKTEKKEAATDPLKDLSASERKTYERLEWLEKNRGDTFKGRAQKFLDAIPAAERYEKEWLTKHPGEEFDEDAKEHESFFAGISAMDGVDDDALESAAEAILTERVTASANKKADEKIAPLAAQQKLQTEMPTILRARVDSARSFFGALGDDFKGILDDKGNIVQAEIDKLAGDTVKVIGLSLANTVELFADQLHRGVLDLPPIPKKNGEPHVSMDDVQAFITRQEAHIAGLSDAPIKDGGQLDEHGRKFASAEEWAAMTADKRKHYWRLDEEKIRKMYVAEIAEQASNAMKAEETRLEQFAAARGYKKDTAAAAKEEKPAETKVETVKAAPSPSATVESRSAPSMHRAAAAENNSDKGLLNRLFS